MTSIGNGNLANLTNICFLCEHSDVLVDFSLVRVDRSRFHFVYRHQATSQVGLKECVHEGDGAPRNRTIDLWPGAKTNTFGEFVVSEGNDLSIGGDEVEVVGSHAVPTEDLCCYW